ncbi:MAG TPA: type II secretion system protein E [Thermomicrobiaceae bacterium]|nr:type II secretion system protein E [Thermomicrobiaceae bacterium]
MPDRSLDSETFGQLNAQSVDPPEQPNGWWGYRHEPPDPLSITRLVDSGLLDPCTAAFLWLAIEAKASVFVVSEPSNAGKTTFLTALLDFLPEQVRRIYLRGWYERFTFMSEDDPAESYLLCNEISSHLPIYLWGRGVRRMFDALHAGFSLATTAHTTGAEGVIELLSAYPLQIPDQLILDIDFVITLGIGRGSAGPARRLLRIEEIVEQAGKPAASTIVEREGTLGRLDAPAGRYIGILSRRFGLSSSLLTTELARRQHLIQRLVVNHVFRVEDVRQAIRAYLADAP